jgi:hypothetical protein
MTTLFLLLLQVIPQPQPVHDGAADQYLFLLVEPLPHSSSSTEAQPLPKVHLLPDSASAQQHLAKSSGSLFFWLLQQGADAAAKETVLRGFGFEANAVPDAGSGLLPVVPAWQVALPGQLLGLAAKDATEPVHSYVKVGCHMALMHRGVFTCLRMLYACTGLHVLAHSHTYADTSCKPLPVLPLRLISFLALRAILLLTLLFSPTAGAR